MLGRDLDVAYAPSHGEVVMTPSWNRPSPRTAALSRAPAVPARRTHGEGVVAAVDQGIESSIAASATDASKRARHPRGHRGCRVWCRSARGLARVWETDQAAGGGTNADRATAVQAPGRRAETRPRRRPPLPTGSTRPESCVPRRARGRGDEASPEEVWEGLNSGDALILRGRARSIQHLGKSIRPVGYEAVHESRTVTGAHTGAVHEIAPVSEGQSPQ
jgi:hypothetical protein